MKFRQLEWKDHVSDDVIIGSTCYLKIYDSVRIEFRIAYKQDENKYYLCSFGQGSIRRMEADKFDSLNEAKTAACEIYNNEMCRMKRAIDSFIEEGK